MKTVSTKLDNTLHTQFIKLCNDDGKCQSEFLRDMIETLCEDCSDEDNQPSTPQDLEIEHVIEPSELMNVTVVDYDE